MSEEKAQGAEVEVDELDVFAEIYGDDSLPIDAEQEIEPDPNTDADNLPDETLDSGEAEQEDPEKDVDDEPERASEEPDKDAVYQQKLKELEDKLEASDKRVRDNQSSYHKEHAVRLELEKELAELKKKRDTDDDFAFLDDEDDEPEVQKPVDVEKIKETVTADVTEKVSQSLAEERWNQAEQVIKAEHEDYDDLIDNVLIPAIRKSEALKEEFQQMGSTPEAAYKLAQMVKDRQEYAKDPDAYIARKIEEKQKEKEKSDEPEKKKTSGLSRNSAKAPSPAQKSNNVLDEIFPD